MYNNPALIHIHGDTKSLVISIYSGEGNEGCGESLIKSKIGWL